MLNVFKTDIGIPITRISREDFAPLWNRLDEEAKSRVLDRKVFYSLFRRGDRLFVLVEPKRKPNL